MDDETKAAIEALRKETEERLDVIERGLLNLRAQVNAKNLRGATAKLAAALKPTGPFVWTCPYQTCDGRGRLPGPPYPPPECRCYQAMRAAMDEHSRLSKLSSPKPRKKPSRNPRDLRGR